ncbi:Snake venom metalloprotease inhibitor 02D01 [Eumeta japonica]|uniref:Snake venom metalloprotease inhibitor 02D01 n=1 Tax=Eumeta variegata TaxID=151549 RepID=A0A4C1YMN8_EUMVA|nr:Snake venom metalloprotease inhibitor 02D01 [Eumeta japonica]
MSHTKFDFPSMNLVSMESHQVTRSGFRASVKLCRIRHKHSFFVPKLWIISLEHTEYSIDIFVVHGGGRANITKFVNEIDTTALEFCESVINNRIAWCFIAKSPLKPSKALLSCQIKSKWIVLISKQQISDFRCDQSAILVICLWLGVWLAGSACDFRRRNIVRDAKNMRFKKSGRQKLSVRQKQVILCAIIEVYSDPDDGPVIDVYSDPDAGPVIDVYFDPDAGPIVNVYSNPDDGPVIDVYSDPDAGPIVNVYSNPDDGPVIDVYSDPDADAFKSAFVRKRRQLLADGVDASRDI